MTGRLSLICLCALLVAVHCRNLRERRSPDSSEEHSWTDTFKNTFDKAKEKVSGAIEDVKDSDAYAKVKEGVGHAGDKLSEIGQNIKNSNAYEKVSSELHSAGEKISAVGDDIKNSDTFQGVKSSLNKAAENIKDKLDD
ncbi:uncharacterized protein LOC128998438 [Macrosteles quadrilineatus]|uniref:uncharacterized protein LOC128998438 n=1 Tax=Macrosteles quadrilineatus TaxID=74068 RepID=UPI0023E20281|nr:uncharacterized protein LOC128998438 [Macrosteles quadrilineatus]